MAIGKDTFSAASGAVSDLFAGFGHQAKAKGLEFEKQNYLMAAGLADKNEKYTEMATAIKEAQSDRELTGALGQTQADVAGAGFAESGSALDILRDSASQGALAHAVLQEQGLITEEGYKVQAESYRNMAKAADVAIKAEKTASIGSYISAAVSGAAAIASLSDARAKRNIALLARLANGLGLYRFNYLWGDETYIGVMAQEVAMVRPDAVMRGDDGYLRVNYGRLGLLMWKVR